MNRLARVLDEYSIEGISTTVPFFRAIVRDANFRRGEFDTGFIDRFQSLDARAQRSGGVDDTKFRDLAAIVSVLHSKASTCASEPSPRTSESRWKLRPACQRVDRPLRRLRAQRGTEKSMRTKWTRRSSDQPRDERETDASLPRSPTKIRPGSLKTEPEVRMLWTPRPRAAFGHRFTLMRSDTERRNFYARLKTARPPNDRTTAWNGQQQLTDRCPGKSSASVESAGDEVSKVRGC